jgi:hypothetical protein
MLTPSTIRDRAVGLVAALSLLAAPAALANPWNERTLITISEPVMVPGATLQPGEYVFKLLDSDSNRHVVQIFKQGDERSLITQTLAVPTRRIEASDDTVLKFNPTESGTPALKAWFYPGTRFGHLFVYPDRQAREIANRTKTIVLSTDVEGSDRQKGTLHVYDAQGQRQPYAPDAQMEREWKDWHETEQRKHTTTAATGGSKPAEADVFSPAGEPSKATAPMVAPQGQDRAMNVRLDQLEDNAQRYIGQTISVDAEVETVHGPRLFTIDEPNWGDVEGELLVYMPTDLAALVREDDRVTVTGTVKRFVKADVEREWGWLNPSDDVIVKLAAKPVLLASRIVGGNNNMAMSVRMEPPSTSARADDVGRPVATSGASSGTVSSNSGSSQTLTDARSIASGGDDLVGRRVKLQNVQLSEGKEHGLWLTTANGPRIYVLPSSGPSKPTAAAGTASIDGVVLQMPGAMRTRLQPGGEWNDEVYIYAFNVER